MAKIAIGTFATTMLGAFATILLSYMPESEAKDAVDRKKADMTALSTTEGAIPQLNMAQAATQPAANQTDALPGGASSLQETYQDWVVVCAQQLGSGSQSSTKRCAMSQQQVNQQGGQRVLALELKLLGSGVEAALSLPFGLALDKGVALQIDDGQISQPFRFRTCLPAGCIVPVTFDAAQMAALQKGVSLKVKAVADGGVDTSFTISLKGFGAALARLKVLTK